MLVDRGNIARPEPAFGVERFLIGGVVVVVAGGDRIAAHEKFTRGGAIVGKTRAVFVDNLEVDAEDASALSALHGEFFIHREMGEVRRQIALGADRAHFGHAPCVADIDVFFLEIADHAGRGGRATDDDIFESLWQAALFVDLALKPEPDRRHAPRRKDFFIVHEAEQAFTVERPAGEDQ